MNINFDSFFIHCSLLVLLISAGGCGGNKPQSQTPQIKKASFSPEDVKVQCSSGECPKEIGLLFFITKLENKPQVVRCTAFLISNNRLVTNNHCIDRFYDGKKFVGDVYFVTPGEKDQRFFSKISGVEKTKKDETAGLISRDYAILSLEKESGLKGLATNSSGISMDREYNLFVANHSGKDSSDLLYDIQKLQGCERVGPSLLHPYSTQLENEVISLKNCKILKGNSGAPLLNNDNEVVGILHGKLDVNLPQLQNEELGRDLDPEVNYLNQFAYVTNWACVESGPCQALDSSSKVNWSGYLKGLLFSELRTKLIVSAPNEGVLLRLNSFRQSRLRFIVSSFPKCYTSGPLQDEFSVDGFRLAANIQVQRDFTYKVTLANESKERFHKILSNHEGVFWQRNNGGQPYKVAACNVDEVDEHAGIWSE